MRSFLLITGITSILLLCNVLSNMAATVQAVDAVRMKAPDQPFVLAWDKLHNRYLVLERDSFHYLKRDSLRWVTKTYDRNGFTRDFDFRDLMALNHGNRILLVLQSGGYVFEMVNDSIIRLDHASNFRVQYGSAKFMMGDTLMSYGGYGFWNFQPFFTRFDPGTGEWEMWELREEKPLPAARSGHTYYYDAPNRDFYMMGGITTRYKARNPIEYTNLDDVWKINMDKGRWEKLGTMRKEFLGINSYSTRFRDWVISYNMERDRVIHLFDLKHNIEMSNTLPSETFDNFYTKTPPAVNEENEEIMYETPPFPLSASPQEIRIAPVRKLMNGKQVTTTIYYQVSWYVAGGFVVLALLFCLVFFLFRSITRPKKTARVDFFVETGILSYRRINIILDDTERKVLRELATDVRYHTLLDLFSRISPDKTSLDLLYKSKRKTFQSINDKVHFITKGETDLFIIRKSPEDHRMQEVKINEEIIEIHRS